MSPQRREAMPISQLFMDLNPTSHEIKLLERDFSQKVNNSPLLIPTTVTEVIKPPSPIKFNLPNVQSPGRIPTRIIAPGLLPDSKKEQFINKAPGLPSIRSSNSGDRIMFSSRSPPLHMTMPLSPTVLKQPDVDPIPLPAINIPASPQTITHRIETPIRRPSVNNLAMPQPSQPIPRIDVRPIGVLPASPSRPQVPIVQLPIPAQPYTEYPQMYQTNPPQYGFNGDQRQMAPSTVVVRPTRPNYNEMSQAQQDDIRIMFRGKYDTLRISFPEWDIKQPPPDYTLDQIHDQYETYVRQIVVARSCDQWNVYLVIMFLGIEVFGIKVLGLDFRGYTKSQVRIMTRFNSLLVELGEKYYSQGASNWPIEARILALAGFNAVIFVIVKYLSKWLGGEGMSDLIQGMIDNFMSGTNPLAAGSHQRDAQGLPAVPIPESSGAAGLGNILGGITNAMGAPGSNQNANPLNGIMQGIQGALGGNAGTSAGGQDQLAGIIQGIQGALGGGAGGGGFDLSGMIANIGNVLTGQMNPNVAGASAQTAPVARATARHRPVFSE